MDGVFLGLGSNLGDRQKFLDKALKLIEERAGRIVKSSSVSETEPWGKLDQPDFLNMVVEIDTDLSPADLLVACQGIEIELGRVRAGRWAPRVIDIDILLYGDRQIDEPMLKIPHPLMWVRDFVMEPLKEIAPEVAKMSMKSD